MTDRPLNYVRCPHCGGNAADIGHPCDEDARQQAVQQAVSRFFAAVKVDPADATADQLRVKLAECEEALAATEAIVDEQDAELDRLRAALAHRIDWSGSCCPCDTLDCPIYAHEEEARD